MRYRLRTLLFLLAMMPLVSACIGAEQNEEKKAVHDPEVIKQLVPLIIGWAKDGTPLPGLPPIQTITYPDTPWLRNRLAEKSAKVIYIACNIKGNEGPERFTYKYDLRTRTVASMTAEDIKEITKQWKTGTMAKAEQAWFAISENKDGSLDVTWGFGWCGGTFVMQRTVNGFEVLAITGSSIR